MRNLTWGIILITIGGLLLLDNLGVADFGDVISRFWPLIIIVWGLSILMKRKQTNNPDSEQPSYTSETDLFHDSNVFGDISVNVTSQNFKGGSASTIFGDCSFDLSKAIFADGEYILRIHNVFGNSHINLPHDAAVSISANTVFGDLAIFGQKKKGFSPHLQVTAPNFDTSPKRMKIIVTKVFGDLHAA